MSNKTMYTINIVLSVIAIGIIVFYDICGGTCSYLKGAIFGIDLKYAGILYMIVLIALNLLKWDFLVLLFVSIALGIEAYLIGFQISYRTFCPFCFAFGIIVISQFIVNFRWSKKWYMVSCIIIGLLFFVFFFKGSVIPTYDIDSSNLPFRCSSSVC
jgi:uncharacterized membrane protein